MFWTEIPILSFAPLPCPRLPPNPDRHHWCSLRPSLLQPLHSLAAWLAGRSCLPCCRSSYLLHPAEVCACEDGENSVVCERVLAQAATTPPAAQRCKLLCGSWHGNCKLLGGCRSWSCSRRCAGYTARPPTGLWPGSRRASSREVTAATAPGDPGQQESGDIPLHAAHTLCKRAQLAQWPRSSAAT